MPVPNKRSRSLRRVHVKVPGGKVKLHYNYKKPKKAHCGKCGAVLSGVPRERPYKMRKLAKTAKRPERPYGGVLCTKCLKKHMIEKARSKK